MDGLKENINVWILWYHVNVVVVSKVVRKSVNIAALRSTYKTLRYSTDIIPLENCQP